MVVEIYDTTLRDGTQGESISLSVNDKLRIASQVSESQVDVKRRVLINAAGACCGGRQRVSVWHGQHQ